MRLPNAAHESGGWRILGIAADFRLEDVWALPVSGPAEDFQAVVNLMRAADPAGSSLPTRALWLARDHLGPLLGLGRIADDEPALAIPGTGETSLAQRLPEDLRGTAADLTFGALPFMPLYRTEDEFAAELSNRTVHAVMHLAWVDVGQGRFQGQMAVYVKPRGPLGHAYMAAIRPFRHVVYPAFLRQVERAWQAQDRRRDQAPQEQPTR